MKCPKCKQNIQAGKEMCTHCGAPITPIPVPSGGKIRFGKYDGYVLDKQQDKMLILTEKVIMQRAYHHEECEITWESSDMRKFLNGEFDNSFSENDRARILETEVITGDNPWYGTRGGNPTIDKIFLLSIEEVIKYFGDSGQLETKFMYPNCDWCKDEFLPWLDDQYNLNRRAVDDNGIVRFWRLRSPGGNAQSVAYIGGFNGDGFDHGEINFGNADLLIDGHFLQNGSGWLSKENSLHTMNGVRPALWLKTSI